MTTRQQVFVGASVLGIAAIAVVALRPRRRPRTIGLAPPSPRKADRPAGYPFDPWSSEADKKRLAQLFLDVRSKAVRDLVPKQLPGHIAPYAEFMRRMAERPLEARDVVKAYLLTVGSIQRGAICPRTSAALRCKRDAIARDPATGAPRWPDHPFKHADARIRPEDALARLLATPAGRRYLDAAARGQLDQAAAETLRRRFSGWGLDQTFADRLRNAPELAREAPEIASTLRHGSRRAWYRFVRKRVPGISTAKAGFFASMLGRGDIATADARELQFWLCPPKHWETAKRACRFPLANAFDTVDRLVDDQFMAEFNRKMRALKVQMPPEYRPFYEHLAHHALWDAVGNTKTTHQAIIDAMESA